MTPTGSNKCIQFIRADVSKNAPADCRQSSQDDTVLVTDNAITHIRNVFAFHCGPNM